MARCTAWLCLAALTVLALLQPVSGSVPDPTWAFTCSDDPFPLAFLEVPVVPCPFDNLTLVSQNDHAPCGSADANTEENCKRARYTGKFRGEEHRIASIITSTTGIKAPASLNDKSFQSGVCFVGTSPFSIRLLVKPLDDEESISIISLGPLITSSSLSIAAVNIVDPSSNAIVATLSPLSPAGEFEYDVVIPGASQAQGKGWIVEIVSATQVGKQNMCIADISTFETTQDVTPGFACSCLQDFSFGSFCDLHTPSDIRKWCHVSSDCDGALVSERTGRLFKNCNDYDLTSSCEEAVVISSASTRLYGTLRNLNNDLSRLPKTCGFGLKDTKGLWFKVLGANRPLTINTCSLNGSPSFSSTAVVMVAQGESVCDNLACLESSLMTKHERVPCGSKFATQIEFYGRKAVWYFVWIGPDGTPFDFIDQDDVLSGGSFDVLIQGASVWADILNPAPSNGDEEEEVITQPFLYSADNYEIIEGNCRQGYFLNVSINTACGSLDPKCDRFIHTCIDIDECADPQLSRCHRHALCTNTPGSFVCKCSEAFTADETGGCVEKSADDLLEIKRQKENADAMEMIEALISSEYSALESNAAIRALKSRLEYLEEAQANELGELKAAAEAANAIRDVISCSIPLFQTFPNINFLGRGYDIFLGNPLSESGVDPGFRLSVIEMLYSGAVSRDGGFSVPDNVDVTREPFAHFDSNVRLISSETEMQSASTSGFGFDLSVGGSYEGAAQVDASFSFSLNKEHQNAVQTLSKSESVFVQIVGRTVIYRSRLNDKMPEKVGAAFAEHVKNLDPSCEYETGTVVAKCLEEEEQKYQTLVETFGTHYTTEVVMGGRAVERYTLTQNEMTTVQTKMATSTLSFDADVSAKFSSFSGFLKTNGEISSQFESTAKSVLTSQNIKRKQWYLGGTAGLGDSDSGSTESLKRWAATVVDNPIPTAVVLAPIPALLTSKQFPDDSSIDRKRKHLFEVLYNACNRKGGENCGQYLGAPIIDESDNTIARFGDFFEIQSLAYNNLPANTKMQLYQTMTNAGTPSNEYYPVRIASFVTDPVTGKVSFTDGSSFDVKTPNLDSSSLQCFCDTTNVQSELIFRFTVFNSAGLTTASLQPVFYFQDVSGTETSVSDYFTSNLNTDGDTINGSGSFYSITKGSLTRIRLVLSLTSTSFADIVSIGSFSARWNGQEYTFAGLLSCTSDTDDEECTTTLSSPSITGSTPYLCGSLETNIPGNALSPTACQTSCKDKVIPSSGPACRYYAFFDTLSRCILADRTDVSTSVTGVSGFKGSVYLRCNTPRPVSVPSIYQSSSAGKYSVILFPASKFTKFQILSPYITYNEARRPIFYGDSLFISSSNGGLSAKSVSSELLNAEPMISVDSNNKIVYKDPNDLNFATFRILSETKPIGSPVKITDEEIIFEIKNGFFTIIFNRLGVVLLGVNPSTNKNVPITILSPADLPAAKFRLLPASNSDLTPSRQDLALILGEPQMEVTINQVHNDWLWVTATFTEDVKRSDGGSLRVKDFSAQVSDLTTGNNLAQCLINSFQSTPNERSANIFNLKIDCSPSIVVPNRQITLSVSAFSTTDFPKSVPPLVFPVVDNRPNVIIGRPIFQDDSLSTRLSGQIIFKYHIITDDNVELSDRSKSQGGRYSITDSFGRPVDCNLVWNTPTGNVLTFDCLNPPQDEEENIVFTLYYPCSLKMVLPGGKTSRLCDDSSLSFESYPLTPFLKVVTIVQGVPSTQISFTDGLAFTSDGQSFSPISDSNISIGGTFIDHIFVPCASSAICGSSVASIDISGVVPDDTTFSLLNPCSLSLWSRTLLKYSPLCVDSSIQSAFLSQPFTLYRV